MFKNRRAELRRHLAPLRDTRYVNDLLGWDEYGLNVPGGNLLSPVFSMC
jgi:hypothetical protein